MERDFDLIRRILQDVEKAPVGEIIGDIDYPDDYPKVVVYEHVKLLLDEKFLEGEAMQQNDVVVIVRISRLTWKGHDFLKATQDESIWHKAKASVLKKTASFTSDLLLEWLKAAAKATYGMP